MVLRLLPLPLTRPAAGVCTVTSAVWPLVLCERTFTPQADTLMAVFCLMTVPLCAVIVVGMSSGWAQRLPLALNAELVQETGQPIATGIGLHHGPAAVGVIGAHCCCG